VNVILFDLHPDQDARIQKHIKYLINNNINVYRINFSTIDNNSVMMHYSLFGEKACKISYFKFPNLLINNLLFIILCTFGYFDDIVINIIDQIGVDKKEPTIIHVHDPTLIPLSVRMRKKLSHAPIVYDRHENFEFGTIVRKITIPKIEHIIESVFSNKINSVILVSNNRIDYIQKKFSKSIIQIIPNFPDAYEYDDKIIYNKITNFNQNTTINIIYIGSLDDSDRDINLMLDVIENINKHPNNINFVIGGRGENANTEGTIISMVNKFNNVNFIGGVPREMVVSITQEAHMGLFFIKVDSLYNKNKLLLSSNKIHENLYCGVIPVVKAKIDHIDLVKQCGLIFNDNSTAEEISKLIMDLVNDRDKLKKLMKFSYNLGRQFTWEKVSIRYSNVYDNLISNDNI